MATLTIADNAGSPSIGAVATIAGGGASDEHTVHTLRIDLTTLRPWQESGTRTGDGTVDLALAKGLWWAYLETETSPNVFAVGSPIPFGVTDGLDALPTRCRQAIIDVLKLLGLPSIGQRVYDRLYFDEANVSFPCIICTTDALAEDKREATSGPEFIGYPTRIEFADNAMQRITDPKQAPIWEKWRFTASQALSQLKLPGVPESVRTVVRPANILEAKQDDGKFKVVSGLQAISVCRAARGLGV